MALREILAKFGFDVDDSKLKKANKDTDGLKESLEKLGKLMAAGFIIQGVRSFIAEMTDLNSQLDNTSTALGISYEDLQRWNVAGKYVDLTAEQMATAMKFLQKNAADAGGEGSKVFKSLGVDVKDASGQIKPVNQLMGDVGLAIAGMQDPAERTAAVLKVFGKQGLALIPLFSQGEEGLSRLLDKIDELGGGITKDAAAALSAIEESQKDWDHATLSLKATIATKFLPALTSAVGWVTKGVVWWNRMSKETHVVEASVIALTGAFIIFKGEAIAAGVKAVAAWAPLIIGLAFAILLIDDLITLFKGGDSVIGRVLHNLFGAAGDSVITQMVKDWKNLNAEISKTPSIGGKIEAGLSTVGASLVRFVVQDIPDFVTQLLFGTTNGFTQVGNMMWSQSGAWVQKIKAQIANIPTALKQLGVDMLQSLADGINSAIDKVEGSLTNLEAKIKEKLKSVFNWHSPIPLFVDLGQDMMGGASLGLDRGQRGVEDALSRNLGGIMPQAGGGGPRSTSIQSSVQVSITAGGGLAGIREAVREGAQAGLGDLNAELAALEVIA